MKASRPNQYWHADITIFRTVDGNRSYIYTVMDNYSRKVLSWEVTNQVSAAVRLETFKQALAKVKNSKVKLIVDGGIENNNHMVDNFIDTTNIEKLIAMKDIQFSNSMVEASNKQLKYQSLFKKQISNYEELVKAVDDFFIEFNTERPNAKLFGFTPDEAYQGFPIDKARYKDQMEEARVERVKNNKANYCVLCT